MQDTNDPESFHLLQISDSVSDSLPDLDLVSHNTNFKKKKVRLKRRDRNQSNSRVVSSVRTGGSGSEDEGLCGLVVPGGGGRARNNNCLLVIISCSAIISLLVLAYITTSLHTRIVNLEQQLRLKIADDDSKSVPDKLQLMDSRVESVIANQSLVAETLRELGLALKDSQGSLAALNTSIFQDRHSLAGQSSKLSRVRQDLELLTNISRNNEDSIKQITDILTSLNINQSSLVKTASQGRP